MIDAAAQPGASGAAPGGRVRIERRGGLAGLRPTAEYDLGSLTAVQQSALKKVFDASAAASPAPGVDRFIFRICLLGGEGEDRSVEVPETSMPGVLAALVRPGLP